MNFGERREETVDEIRHMFYPLDENAELPYHPTEALEGSIAGINSLFALAELHLINETKHNAWQRWHHLPSFLLQQPLEHINNIWECRILPEEW